jgi:uncharacterized protein YdcH (DUF465 family)
VKVVSETDLRKPVVVTNTFRRALQAYLDARPGLTPAPTVDLIVDDLVPLTSEEVQEKGCDLRENNTAYETMHLPGQVVVAIETENETILITIASQSKKRDMMKAISRDNHKIDQLEHEDSRNGEKLYQKLTTEPPSSSDQERYEILGSLIHEIESTDKTKLSYRQLNAVNRSFNQLVHRRKELRDAILKIEWEQKMSHYTMTMKDVEKPDGTVCPTAGFRFLLAEMNRLKGKIKRLEESLVSAKDQQSGE